MGPQKKPWTSPGLGIPGQETSIPRAIVVSTGAHQAKRGTLLARKRMEKADVCFLLDDMPDGQDLVPLVGRVKYSQNTAQ